MTKPNMIGLCFLLMAFGWVGWQVMFRILRVFLSPIGWISFFVARRASRRHATRRYN